MSSSKFGSHMQTLVQTQKMDQLEQEVHELRGEVTTLRAEVEKLTSLVSSLMATNDPPLVQQRPQSPYQPMCPQKPRQQAPRQFIPQNQVPQKFIPQNQVQKASQCDPIPVKYADLLPILLKKNLIQTLPLPRVPNSLPPWYRPDLNCVFHQGAPGHDTEQCYPLKEEVQKLIENNVWSFDDQDIKVLLQHLAPHSVAAVRPITNVVQDPGYQPQFQQYQQQPRQQAPRIKFDPIPIKYAKLLPYLLERNLVQIRPPPPIPKILPARWRPDLFCVFHQGAQGHDVERCFSLKIAVQKLIEDDLIPFEEFGSECAS
ncbi:putative transcription factor bZIP family [Medicago truncatula]|uniref:Putative transcription factor bZIP family n=1 Tax=Medicago truncatula TaxID=3880 RepID=A0A396J5N1_MEDTR|nr:putative transcription factor bZIP family [Medicago truncatula]